MKTKIWGIGLSRTGTTTLSHVLNEVGFKHIHYPTEKQIYSMDNDGASDIPVIPIYKELDKKFPNSKFVLTVRDKETWLKSIEPFLKRKEGRNIPEPKLEMRRKVYGVPYFDYDAFAKTHDEYEKDVMEYFKDRPDDLLVINIADGKDSPQKLFKFLGIEREMTKFPHLNKLKGKKNG